MKNNSNFGAIDHFRIIAAALVVVIHTADIPFLGETGNLLLSNVIARVAVPFFFAVTGFFTDFTSETAIKKLLAKTALMYAAATAVYLPYGSYSVSMKQILFDGTFYHLWYFPALGIGALTVFALKKLPNAALPIASALYAFGLCGDTYQTLARSFEPLRKTLDLCSNVFSFTRNGIFFAPLFLLIGSVIGNKLRRDRNENRRTISVFISALCFALSLILLAVERFSLNGIIVGPRDSMYISLIPCTVFLMLTLGAIRTSPRPALRRISLWIYVIHPVILDLTARISNSLSASGTFNADAWHAVRAASISLITAAVIGIIPAIKNRMEKSRFGVSVQPE